MKSKLFLIIFILGFFFIGCKSISKLHLSQNDIEIYMNNFNAVKETINNNWHNNDEWEEYYLKMYSHYESYYRYSSGKDKFSNIKDYKIEFNKIINCTAPKELNDIFNGIGWNNDGNKIFYTIYFGCLLLDYKKDAVYQYEIGQMSAILYFPLFFDREMRNEWFKEMKKVRKQLKSINKALKIINKNNLQLIENNYEELTKMYIAFKISEFPNLFIGTWERAYQSEYDNTLTFTSDTIQDSTQDYYWDFYFFLSDEYIIETSDTGYRYSISIKFENGNLIFGKDNDSGEHDWEGEWKKR